MRQRLNDLVVSKLPFTGKQYVCWDASLPSFGCRVYKGKSFVLKQQNRWITIGPYPIVGLKDARDEAKRRLLTRYIPQTSSKTGDALDLYFEAKKANTRATSLSTYTVYLKRLDRTRALSSITQQDINALLTTMTKSSAIVGLKVYKAFFSWCVDNGHLAANPLQGSKSQHKAKSRDRLLTNEEVVLIWRASYNDTTFGAMLRLLLLTGQRLSQVCLLERNWLNKDTILFPASCMKGNMEHTIPLTTSTKSELSRLSTNNGNYIWGDKPFNPTHVHVTKFRSALNIPHWTVHDFRRYFSSSMASLKVRQEVTEKLLAHKTSGVLTPISQVYNRHTYMDEMRDALEKFHAHLAAIGCNATETDRTNSTST